MRRRDTTHRPTRPRAPCPLPSLATVGWLGPALFGVSLLGSCPVWAQEARSTGISTTLDSSLTYLDSKRVDALYEGSDLITEVRPGLRYSSRSGRVRGSMSYGLGLVHHTRGTPTSEAQHQLAASLKGELIERRAFVDVVASIGKQSVSAYGQQSVDANRADNANLAEVGNLSISPYLSGTLGDMATYNLRLNASATNTRKSIEGDSTTTGGSVSLNSAGLGKSIGWGLQVSSQTTDFRTTGDSTNDRATASINFAPDVDWSFSLRAGQESSDIGSVESQTSTNWGGSARWQPTPRTVAEVNTDRRFFGRSHSVTLSHRFPLSSLRFTSTRDLTLSSNPAGLGQPQTLYQQFFDQFASEEPDPILREQLVLTRLAGQGLDPNGTVGGGFINTGASLQERHDFSWSYSVRRLTLAGQAFASRSGQIGDTSVNPVGEDTRQRGYNSTLSYRLTPTASVGINGSRLMTKPTASLPGTDLKTLSVSLTERLGMRTTASLSARYSVFNSAFLPYRESAVTASLAMRF